LPDILGFVCYENSLLLPYYKFNPINNMASTLSTIDLTSCEAFATPSKLPFTLLNAFGQMMQPQLQSELQS
jgi:hypothetical protein